MDLQSILSVVKEYVPIVLAFIGAFALIATKTKNTTDNKIVQALYDIINIFGANFGNAKNKDD